MAKLIDSTTIANDSVRNCAGHVGAYLNGNKIVYFSNVCCIPVISAIGIACNILNVVILCRRKTFIPSATYLLALALSDCCFLVFGTLELTPIHVDSLSSSPRFNEVYATTVVYIRMIASTCYKESVLLVLAFNVERYLCVCQPLKWQKYFNQKLQTVVVIFSLIISLVLSLQFPLSYRKEACYNTITNNTYYLVALSKNELLQDYYRLMDWVNMIFFNIAPVVSLAVLNTCLIITLRNVLQKQSNSNKTGNAENRNLRKRMSVSSHRTWGANAILFAVTAMFVVCLAPQIPARALFKLCGPTNRLVITYMALSQQLIFLNASLNFCLYCLVSKKYRFLMRKTFRDAKRFFRAKIRKSENSSADNMRKASSPRIQRDNHRLPSYAVDMVEAQQFMCVDFV